MDRRLFLQCLASTALAAESPDDRAKRLHRDSLVAIIHDHRPIAPDIALMRAGGVTAKLYQIGVDVDIGPDIRAGGERRAGWAARSRADLETALQEIKADPKNLVLALTVQDIRRAKQDGKIAILLGVEGGKLLEGNLENLSLFHRLGLRELQLRWAVPNQLVEKEDLTDFGRAVVQECNRLGIVVDLTHIPEKAFFQAIALTNKPPIVSHGTGGRDLNDKRLKALADKGGVLGIHFYSTYLGEKPTVARALDAIDYVKDRVGTDTIGLGVDFFPAQGKWREFQNAQRTKDISWAIPDLSHMEKITRGLVARNYSDEQIAGILGDNFLRACQATFGS